jgi:hypothetical protein
MHALGVWFHELFTSMAEKPTAASVEEWFARFAAAASPVIRRLLWTLGGYAVAVVVAEVAGRRVTVQPEPSAAVFGPAAPAVVPPASAARKLFESSNYAVKPRKSWGGLIMRAFSDYDIRAVPSMAHNRFSFSWSTGVIRREPDGPDLIAVRKREGQSWFSSPSYTVIDLATGASLAMLTPQGADWQIANARGETLGTVVQDRVGIGNLHYVAHVGPHHVCSFVWAMHGLSVFSAELDIEFAQDCDERFDRSIAMGLAPLIEQKARLTSERHR